VGSSAQWCHRCFHPISPADWAFVEAYREFNGVEAKVHFHLRCYTPGGRTFFDARVIQLPPEAPSSADPAPAFRRAHFEAIGRVEDPQARPDRSSRR
jgi:hypothetical protein